MANFGKFGNLSHSGWSDKTQTQVITVGQSAHIGLWGGDGDGEDLQVKAVNGSVCITHEEPRPSAPHWRHFLLTGLREGTTEINAFVAGTSNRYSAPITVKVVGKAAKRMVFFPGERLIGAQLVGTIYVIGDKGEHISAAGGPAVGFKDRGGHTADPTPAGKYTLGPKHHVTTSSWPMSIIPWGANLRFWNDEAQYEYAPGKWRYATGAEGVVTKAQYDFDKRTNPKAKPDYAAIIVAIRNKFIIPGTGLLRDSTYKKNDFGRWGWNLRRNGAPTAYYIHTTPDDEATSEEGKEVFLKNSHGCIHLKPKELKMLDDDLHVLKEGASFEVRHYNEVGPP